MDTVADIYTDGTYASKNPKFGDDSAGWKAGNARAAISKWGIPHRSVVEVGCGGGAILRDIARSLDVRRAVGYEPMPEAYAVAKGRETENLKFVNQTVGRGTEGDFDLALCFDVFEHVEDCFSLIRNVASLSDRILFHIPLDLSVQMVARMSPLMRVRDGVGHIHYFSKDTALATLRHCELQVSGWFYTFGGDGSYGGRLYRMLKMPRKLAFAINQDLAVRWLGGWSLMAYVTKGAAGGGGSKPAPPSGERGSG